MTDSQISPLEGNNMCQAKDLASGEAVSPSALQASAVRTLWDTISDMELAIIALGVPDLVDGWGEPRHRQELGVTLRTNAQAVYRLYDAYARANTIINDLPLFDRLFSASAPRPGEEAQRADTASPVAEQEPDIKSLLAENTRLREACADDLRAKGWRVAVHNDYRLDGIDCTFWLFTHPDGRWIKGEGPTDADAIRRARALSSALPSSEEPQRGDTAAHLASGSPDTKIRDHVRRETIEECAAVMAKVTAKHFAAAPCPGCTTYVCGKEILKDFRATLASPLPSSEEERSDDTGMPLAGGEPDTNSDANGQRRKTNGRL
jgi:hypothetical protein